MIVTSQPRVRKNWVPVGKHQVQDYYVSRPCAREAAYSWGPTVDPDGNIRNRLAESERIRWLDDNRELIDSITALPGKMLCDVGCGPGWLLRALSQSFDGCGIETSPEACTRLRCYGIHHRGDLRALPEQCMDVVVAHHVIEHMTDPIAEIGHMRAILKPGGWLVLGTPDFGCPCAVRFGENFRMLCDPTHVSLFTLESMHRFLRDHGFTIRDVKFPFPSRYATAENFARWNDTSKVSPPWPGNWVTYYARR